VPERKDLPTLLGLRELLLKKQYQSYSYYLVIKDSGFDNILVMPRNPVYGPTGAKTYGFLEVELVQKYF